MLLRKAAAFIFIALSGPASAGQLLMLHQQAANSDPQIRAALADARAQQQQGRQLRASLLPTLGASAALNRTREKTENSNFQGIENTTTYATTESWRLRLTQPLFDGAAFAQFAQVDDQYAIAEANTHKASQDLILRLTTTYFDWLAAHDNLRFAKAELAAIGKALEQAKVRYEVGLAAITDKQEAQARYDLARSSELVAAAQLRSQTQALRTLTAEVPATAAKIGKIELVDAPEPGDPDAWVEQGLENNLDLLISQAQTEIARQAKNAARAGYWPTLNLVAEHGFLDNSDAQFGRETTSSQASLQFSLPLFAGGANHARHQENVARFEAAAARSEQTRRGTEQQVRDAYDGVVTGAATVRALQQATRSAQTALDAVSAGVEVGTRTNVDLLDAQRELFRARRDLARARYDYLLNILRLEQSVGSLDIGDLERIDAMLSFAD